MATPGQAAASAGDTPSNAAEIEASFKLIAPSLGLPQSQLDKMTLAHKETLVKQHSSHSAVGHEKITPETIIKRLESGKNKEPTVEKLRICISSELLPWTDHFLELKGHLHLFEIFSGAFSKEKKSEKNIHLIAECCRCMKALMNTPEGLERVLEWNKSIELLLDSLENVNILSQAEVLLVLAGLCFLSTDAHVRILSELRKSNRIPDIMEYVSSKNEALTTAALTFVNALIRATGDTQSRVEIRNEFLKMNIRDIVNKERMDPSESLVIQVGAFNQGADEDLDTLIKAGAISTPTVSSPNTDALRAQITKLETQVKSLEFELSGLKEENVKLKSQPPTVVQVVAAAPGDANATAAVGVAPAVAEVGGGPPPPPPPGGVAEVGGGPPPPPPPSGGGGPPPPPPPPGGGGGPPPPPPPPGGGPGGPPPPPGGGPGGPPPPAVPKRPAKAKCKPNKKMRAFGWNKIADAKIDNTIWEKTNDSRVKLDTLELESLFGISEGSSAAGGSGAAPSTKIRTDSVASPSGAKKAPAIQLLDPKRSNNCEIMLRGLKMEPAAIRTAIMSLDEKLLTEDTLKTMKEYVPLPEEIATLKEFTGDKKSLGRAEQYFLAVMDIPKLSARLTALAFKVSFNEKAEIAKSEIQTLSNAITAVKGNKNLFELLEVVLAVGNYLNGAGNNGGCYGFRINSLNKMLEVKSSDNKMTLMHYLYDLLSKKHSHVLAVITELACCGEASRMNIREAAAKVAELKAGFTTVSGLLQDPSVDSAFTKSMSSFIAEAKTTVEALESRSAKLEPAFKECVTYYGEPGSTEPEDFFGALSNFVEALGRAKGENEKRAAAVAKDAQSKALLAAVQSRQVAKKKGQLDDAIEGMKNGTMFARLSVALPAPK